MSLSYRHQHVPRPPQDDIDYESIRQEMQLISSDNFHLNQKLKGDNRVVELSESVRRAFLSSGPPTSPAKFTDNMIKRKQLAADEERQRENDMLLVNTPLALPTFGGFKRPSPLSKENEEKRGIISHRSKHGTALSSKKRVNNSSLRQPTQAFTGKVVGSNMSETDRERRQQKSMLSKHHSQIKVLRKILRNLTNKGNYNGLPVTKGASLAAKRQDTHESDLVSKDQQPPICKEKVDIYRVLEVSSAMECRKSETDEYLRPPTEATNDAVSPCSSRTGCTVEQPNISRSYFSALHVQNDNSSMISKVAPVFSMFCEAEIPCNEVVKADEAKRYDPLSVSILDRVVEAKIGTALSFMDHSHDECETNHASYAELSCQESGFDEGKESTNKSANYSQYQMIINKSQVSNVETNSLLHVSNVEDNRITSEAKAYKTKSMVEKSSQRESDSDEEEESTNKTVDYSQYQMIFNKSQASNIETNSPLNMSNDEDNRITSEARAYKTKSMVEESSQRTQLFGETSEGGKNRSVGLDGILEKQRGNAISGSSYMYTEIDHWESKSAMSDGYDATGNHEVSRSSSILPQTHDWAKGTQAKRSLPPSSNFDSEFLLGGESEKKGMGKENVDLLKIKDGSMCDASAISLEVRNESLIVDDDYSEDFIDEGDDRPNFSENVGVGENMPLIASFEANLPSFDKKSCLPPTATAEQYIPELEDDYSQNFDEDCEGTLQDLKHTNISREEEQEDDNISCDTGETAVDTRCRKNMDLSFEDNKDDGACCIDETNEIRRSSSPLYESKVHSNGSYCDAERQESEEVCVYTQTLSNHSPLDLQALEESTDSIRSNLAIVRKEEEEPTPQTSAENFSPRTMNACDISFATETASESFSATGFSPYLLKGRAANSKT